MLFSEVLGHEKLKLQLSAGVKSGKSPHAFLFSGNEGNGAMALALALAQFLNCENKQENESCNNCNSCNKSKKFIHPDLHFSFPVFTKTSGKPAYSKDFLNKWRDWITEHKYFSYTQWMAFIADENKQGNISAAECNEIVRLLSLKHYEGEYKIIIIWQAELLGKEGNKLLKIIEEPPQKTIFILITNNEEEIIGTIKSRTQLVKVPSYSNTEILNYITKTLNVEANFAEQVANIADGNLIDAIQLCKENSTNFSEIMLQWFRAVFKKDTTSINEIIDKIAAIKRTGQKHLCLYCVQILRAALQYKYQSQSLNRISEKENQLIKYLGAKLNFYQIEAMVKSFDNLYYYIGRNANAKIQFFNSYILHYKIVSNQQIDTVV